LKGTKMGPITALKEPCNTYVKVQVAVFPLTGSVFAGGVYAAKKSPMSIV
jgi:hypothetical protein